MIIPTLLLLAACAPHPIPIGGAPIPEGDVSVAIVGSPAGGEAGAREVTAAVLGGGLGAIVLLGDPVRTSSRRQWDAALALWQDAADAGAWVRPLVGEAAASGDPRLTGLRRAFPGTPSFGVAAMGGVDVVFTDASSDADRHAEQTFWLPRVMGGPGPKVVLVPAGPHGAGVVGAVLDYAPVGAGPLAVFVAGDESGCAFPGGAFAEARVTVGPLASGWWRLDLRGGTPTLWFHPVDEATREASGWRYASDIGWRRLP